MKFFRRYNISIVMAAMIAAIFISGCGLKLTPDASPISSIDANYPSAEFRACGKLWNGLGVCRLTKSQSYNDVKLQIQGYGTGTGAMKVDSRDCAVNSNFSFEKNQLVDIAIAGKSTKSCVVTFTVAPEYDKTAGVTVYPLRGILLLRVTEDTDDWTGWTFKEKGSWLEYRDEFSGGDGPVKVFATGCGVNYQKTLPLLSGNVTLPLHEAVTQGQVKTCVLDGNIVNPVFKDLFFDYVISQYDPSYVALPIPVASMISGGVYLEADPSVAVISVNDDYKFSSSGTFLFDTTKYAVGRALTVKGRNVVGVWNPTTKGWTWVQ